MGSYYRDRKLTGVFVPFFVRRFMDNSTKFPTIMINFQFPWGNLMLYYEVPAELVNMLVESKRHWIRH
jgi:hypothetical protein